MCSLQSDDRAQPTPLVSIGIFSVSCVSHAENTGGGGAQSFGHLLFSDASCMVLRRSLHCFVWVACQKRCKNAVFWRGRRCFVWINSRKHCWMPCLACQCVARACAWPAQACPRDDNVRVTRACEWPMHPCPRDDNVRVTSACEWPEHPCPRDDNIRAASACEWPEHPCPHDHNVRVTSACQSARC